MFLSGTARFLRGFSLAALLLLLLPFRDAMGGGPDPAYFYIEFHIDSAIRDKADFDRETTLLRKLADILEKHGARGSLMFLDEYPKSVKTYSPGQENPIRELERRGHEIGVHHRAFDTGPATIAGTIRELKDRGAKDVESLTAGFQRLPDKETEICTFDPERKNEQLEKMIEDVYRSGITSAFRWCMPDSTPFSPRKDNWIVSDRNVCVNEESFPDPGGEVVAVGMYDGAGYTFPENDGAFREILHRVEAALPRFDGGRIHYFPVAIHDYYFFGSPGPDTGGRPATIDENRLRKLDDFLSSIDGFVKMGPLRYATRRDVTRAFRAGNPGGAAGRQAMGVFFTVHVHSAADFRPEFEPLSREEFEGTVKTLQAISRTLEAHRAKGSFQIMQSFAEGARTYQGTGTNILKELEKRGHEIGSHVHTDRFDQWRKTRDAILSAGLDKVPTMSGMKLTSVPMDVAFQRMEELGFTLTTGNNCPLDLFPIEGLKGAASWGFPGNELYVKTGAFLFPWLPDYARKSISRHDPGGKILYLDAVPPNTWRSGNVPVRASDFGKLRSYFDAALDVSGGGRTKTWGFVMHETDFQTRKQGFNPTNPVDTESIKALDDFLSYLEKHGETIAWMTTQEINAEFRARKK